MDDFETFAHLRRAYVRRVVIVLVFVWYYFTRIHPRGLPAREKMTYSLKLKQPMQFAYIHRICMENDVNYKNVLRMDRYCFHELCILLSRSAGLKDSQWVSVKKKVANFLIIVGHHMKNRLNMFAFQRCGHTISIYFHEVLKAVLQLHELLIAKPEPISPDCQEEPYRHFKGCLGALDGTYIEATCSTKRSAWYRSRKGSVSINVLGVCDFNMRFIYVLSGWEGSAADAKVLSDAVTQDEGALKVPVDNYYLVDVGYGHAPGFMAPYRRTRYHLQEWSRGDKAPLKYKEYFNLKHASTRNVIERTWGLLKKRFSILRSPSFYSLDTQNHTILACCLLHNFLRNHAPDDVLDEEDSSSNEEGDEPPRRRARTGQSPTEFVSLIELEEPSWVDLRDVIATMMYTRYREYLSVRQTRRLYIF